ncbi:DinB family protein [Planococcus ruber]|uniref:DinB family protein n=1 Tax=Planococcus ruber TaxID=2027871 RepID=UPI001FEEFDB8|nr:DinB family protein [Planococcus ruber]MCJ1908478.1 DinB family protein [Planococcus ruber]
MEKMQLIDGLNDYEVFLASLNTSVRTEAEANTPIAEGKWSIAQIIMHLAEWDRFMREERLPQMEQGGEVERLPDVDAFNEAAVKPVASMKFQEVLAHAQKQRALLVREIEGMSDARWHFRFRIGQREMDPAAYFAGILEHDAHHRQQIEDFLA